MGPDLIAIQARRAGRRSRTGRLAAIGGAFHRRGQACIVRVVSVMGQRILITGGAGSIGTALRAALERQGNEVAVLDLRASGEERADVRDAAAVARALRGCAGVVHLAAVSRVAWAERDPDACQATNVGGTRAALGAALQA